MIRVPSDKEEVESDSSPELSGATPAPAAADSPEEESGVEDEVSDDSSGPDICHGGMSGHN